MARRLYCRPRDNAQWLMILEPATRRVWLAFTWGKPEFDVGGWRNHNNSYDEYFGIYSAGRAFEQITRCAARKMLKQLKGPQEPAL